MELRTLKYFITIAECQNFSKASKLLHISQPTLSRQIAYLEEELGVTLFIRTKPNIKLTQAGELCLEKSRDILIQYENMCAALSEIKKGNTGSVSIGYVNLSQFRILSNVIEYINENYPNIKLKIIQMSLPEVQDAIIEKKLDIGFDMRLNINDTDNINYKKVTNSNLYAVVSVRHKFAKRESISINELKDEKIVIFERKQAPELFDSITNLCFKEGFIPNFAEFRDDMESVIMAAGLGEGIALMDETAKILETEYTVFVPIDDCEINYNWYLTWHKENKNPCIKIVVDSIYS